MTLNKDEDPKEAITPRERKKFSVLGIKHKQKRKTAPTWVHGLLPTSDKSCGYGERGFVY